MLFQKLFYPSMEAKSAKLKGLTICRVLVKLSWKYMYQPYSILDEHYINQCHEDPSFTWPPSLFSLLTHQTWCFASGFQYQTPMYGGTLHAGMIHTSREDPRLVGALSRIQFGGPKQDCNVLEFHKKCQFCTTLRIYLFAIMSQNVSIFLSGKFDFYFVIVSLWCSQQLP